MRAQTTNINEELGQIEYIFSDKTGTLTCNIMEFQKFSTKSGSYNVTEKGTLNAGTESGQQSQNNLNFWDKTVLDSVTGDRSSNHFKSVEETLLHLALCHSVVIDKRTSKMNSASPDELALVEGAAQQGYIFKGKDADSVISILRKSDGKVMRYELLNILEFNSTRKRMSVIIRDCETNELKLLCKGADSIIKARLDLENNRDNTVFMDKTQKYVDAYAEEGLRTLLLSQKVLDPKYYEQWNEDFNEAMGSVVDKEEKVDKVQNEIEQDMLLVGSTAIEDRL